MFSKLLIITILLQINNVISTVGSGTCSTYSATSSATTNYVVCPITVCGGEELVATTCGAGTGDTYLRLFSTNSQSQVAG